MKITFEPGQVIQFKDETDVFLFIGDAQGVISGTSFNAIQILPIEKIAAAIHIENPTSRSVRVGTLSITPSF